MLAAVIPSPCQMPDMRSNSVSKQAQQSFPRFRRIPRGVRLFVGQPFPSFVASSEELKNGKFGSANGDQLFVPLKSPSVPTTEKEQPAIMKIKAVRRFTQRIMPVPL